MSIDISPEIKTRLAAKAHAEGMSVDAFLARLIDDREELTAIIERTEAHAAPLSQEDLQTKIERGFLESERDEVMDGDAFTAGLLRKMDEMEAKRRVG